MVDPGEVVRRDDASALTGYPLGPVAGCRSQQERDVRDRQPREGPERLRVVVPELGDAKPAERCPQRLVLRRDSVGGLLDEPQPVLELRYPQLQLLELAAGDEPELVEHPRQAGAGALSEADGLVPPAPDELVDDRARLLP